MAVKKVNKRKKATPQVVSMSGGWEQPIKKRKKRKKLSGINTSDMPKMVLDTMVQNGKLSASGFAGQIIANTVVNSGVVKGLNGNGANTGVYIASVIGAALLPKKMKSFKMLLDGVAIVAGARVISNIGEKVGLNSANHYDTAQTAIDTVDSMAGYEMAGYEMAGYEMAGNMDSVNASVTDNYVSYPNQYDEFED